MKWLVRIVAAVAVVYAAFFMAVLIAMNRPPEEFGQFMKRMPQAAVWGALPARQMWLSARNGSLKTGDSAPDFTLSTHDHKGRVTLSSYRGDRPVVLVFGSYT